MTSTHGYSVDSVSDVLHNGDCMDQHLFHSLYAKTSTKFRAELIDGIVYVREPVGRFHADGLKRLVPMFAAYEALTPGVESLVDASVILGEEDEVQPDLCLRVLPDFGGQSRNAGKFISGAPELVLEVSHSSLSIDLHRKRKRYEKAGVIEYIVVCLKPLECHWFDLQQGNMLGAGADQFFRSGIFPGLWLHRQSLLSFEYELAMNTVKAGIASDEHQQFCERLTLAKQGK